MTTQTDNYSEQNPCEILGRLDPPLEWYTAKRVHVPDLIDSATGQPLRDAKGKPIKAFTFLPRNLPSTPAGHEIETFFKKHPGFCYQDLWARMPAGTPYPTQKQKNAWKQQRLRHGRVPYNARCWTMKGHGLPRVLLELVEGLSQLQIQHNTTWIVTANGIVQPNNPTRVLPLDSFLDQGRPHLPSGPVRNAQAEIARLQAVALANNLMSWRQLPQQLLPMQWFARVRGPVILPPSLSLPAAISSAGTTSTSPQVGYFTESDNDDTGASSDNDVEEDYVETGLGSKDAPGIEQSPDKSKVELSCSPTDPKHAMSHHGQGLRQPKIDKDELRRTSGVFNSVNGDPSSSYAWGRKRKRNASLDNQFMDGPRLKHANTNNGLEQTVDQIDAMGQTYHNTEHYQQASGKKEELPQGLKPRYEEEDTFGIFENFEEDGECLEATDPNEKYAAFDFVKEEQEDS